MDRVRNTPLGTWLATAAPEILKSVGGLIAEKAVWPLIQKMLNRRRMSKDDMKHAVLLAEVSFTDVKPELWKHDNLHGSWLTRNARPLMVFISMLGAFTVTVLESTGHDVSDLWEGVWGTLCFTTVGAYFTVQTLKNDGRSGRHRRKFFGRRVDSSSSVGTSGR